MTTVLESTLQQHLCIGCGFCAATCPRDALVMAWVKQQTWQPQRKNAACTHCGQCVAVCPNTPARLAAQAEEADRHGIAYGLPADGDYFIAHDANLEAHLRSASGGALTLLLQQLLALGAIDGVIACVPLTAPMGEPHYEMRVLRSVAELDGARSSCYYPLTYDAVLREISVEGDGRFALVGVPCILRGVPQLPPAFRDRIVLTCALACSHNVTGDFLDALAKQEGVTPGVPYRANLRDKQGISRSTHFNNVFYQEGRELRRSRFDTAFTDMWRGYFFAQPACLYCPDFFGAEADLTVKDAWGRLCDNPHGLSLLAVRNPAITRVLRRLSENGMLALEETTAQDYLESQTPTARFKHQQVKYRQHCHAAIRDAAQQQNSRIALTRQHWWAVETDDYWQFVTARALSVASYAHFTTVPVAAVLSATRIVHLLRRGIRLGLRTLRNLPSMGKSMLGTGKRLVSRLLTPWLRRVVLRPPSPTPQRLRVLITGGYGFRNIGDEAQLAANIAHWQRLAPACRISVFAPRETYTEQTHGVRTELAPRVVLFHATTRKYYTYSSRRFKLKFFIIAPLLLCNAALIRTGLPIIGLPSGAARLLDIIYQSDVLFLSGGGYLTGSTLSRLWENMLIIRLAAMLGVPTILSGQTIGVFQTPFNRWLAAWGLRKASLIYLRDHTDSPNDLAAIGITGDHVVATFDDALFCPSAPHEMIEAALRDAGVAPTQPYIAVNVHRWGQSDEDYAVTLDQMAVALDAIVEKYQLPIVFVPMHQVDVPVMDAVSARMHHQTVRIDHGSHIGLAIGLIRQAHFCLTMKHHPIIFAMGNAVPTVAIAFRDYYIHKNKGAMSIFGQEHYTVICTPTDLARTVLDKVDELMCRYPEERATIQAALDSLRPRAGEPIARWLRQQGLLNEGSVETKDSLGLTMTITRE